MRIGIDFDNTIANYDEVFCKVAFNNKLIKKDWSGNKQALRKKIIKDKNEEVWKKLQGLVYGKYMHLAKLSEGFINFLFKSKLLGAKVYIVSHKTIYGHYDRNKVPLRQVALKWIIKKKIPEFEKIYFEDSIDNKIRRINNLKLDYFIDDLELILKNRKFSKETNKILFSRQVKKKLSKNIKQFNKWSNIRKCIFGPEGLKEIKTYAEFISKKKIFRVNKIKGQRNSQLYKIIYKDGLIAALKNYPAEDLDRRKRLKREYESLQLMKKNGFKDVSKVLYQDENLNIIIFQWISGIKPIKIDNHELNKSINFIKKIKKISRKTVGNFYFDAVESCKSLKDITSQINYKMNDLLKSKNNSEKFKHFLRFMLKPTYMNLHKEAKHSKMYKLFIQPINKNYEILSPSDFGFHNAIKKSKKIIFIDFEYFGKDDPVKLAADFLLHPGMKLKDDQKKKWLKAVLKVFKRDKYFEQRLKFLIPFYAIRWSLIVLNDFRKSDPNQENYKNFIVNKKLFFNKRIKQINKSLYFCNLVRSRGYQKWLN